MDDFELRILKREEVSTKTSLEVFKREEVSTKTSLEVFKRNDPVFTTNTDLAILTGGATYVDDIGYYSLQPDLKKKEFYYMDVGHHYVNVGNAHHRVESVRPVLHFINSTAYRNNLFYDENKIPKLQFGEYPQYVLKSNDAKIVNELNEKLMDQTLKKTGKKYCFYYGEDDKPASIRYGIEYFYNDKKYMPFTAIVYNSPNRRRLSIGEICPSRIYWLKVEPITWLYDEETDLFIAEKALVAGVGLGLIKEGNDFESTEMYEFLNTHMKQDMLPFQGDKSNLLDESESLKKYVYKNYGRKRQYG